MVSVWRAMDSESVQASVRRVAIVGMYPQFNKSKVWDCTGLEAKNKKQCRQRNSLNKSPSVFTRYVNSA